VTLLAGCGDNSARSQDAGLDVGATPCAAAFSGDFAERTSGGSDCPVLRRAGDVAIDLGATPSAGSYTPEITATWSALVTSSVNSGCVFSAGNASVPNGTFSLDLATIAPGADSVHGTLVLHTYVHALVLQDCGTAPTEHVELEF
jgi:hypothetical protein